MHSCVLVSTWKVINLSVQLKSIHFLSKLVAWTIKSRAEFLIVGPAMFQQRDQHGGPALFRGWGRDLGDHADVRRGPGSVRVHGQVPDGGGQVPAGQDDLQQAQLWVYHLICGFIMLNVSLKTIWIETLL